MLALALATELTLSTNKRQIVNLNYRDKPEKRVDEDEEEESETLTRRNPRDTTTAEKKERKEMIIFSFCLSTSNYCRNFL